MILERPTVEQLLGDVRGESLLDLACGEGHYARLAADPGASPVCAVDISAEMIALAEQEERERPRGVHYHCVPAERFEPAGVNDVVLAVYLLTAPGMRCSSTPQQELALRTATGDQVELTGEHLSG